MKLDNIRSLPQGPQPERLADVFAQIEKIQTEPGSGYRADPNRERTIEEACREFFPKGR